MCVPTGLLIHVGDDRDLLFLCLLRIKFWVLIFIFKEALTTVWIRVTIPQPLKKDEGVLCFLLLVFSDHMFIISFYEADHIMAIGVFLLCSKFFVLRAHVFFSVSRVILSASTIWKQDHMTIIRYSDLTTSLTINRTGLLGDSSTTRTLYQSFRTKKHGFARKITQKTVHCRLG